jgi:hypothetical protein
MIRIGIYGYECTKEAIFDTYKIIPVSNEHSKVSKLSSSQNTYNLTAFLEVDNETIIDLRQLIFDLEAVLSFIDQKDIIVSNELNDSEEYDQLGEDYPKFLNGHYRHNGGGKVIMSDASSKDSRKSFIDLAMTKLTDRADSNNETFRSAFFKTIEVFRAKEPFTDVSYYLMFSALESLSRAVFNDYSSRNCAEPIAKLLRQYDFDIFQDNTTNLYKSVSTYVHLRNALFHNGKFEADVNFNGSITKLKLSTYYPLFKMLMPLVLMKYIGFDDGHINWNRWIDRMMFKPKSQ